MFKLLVLLFVASAELLASLSIGARIANQWSDGLRLKPTIITGLKNFARTQGIPMQQATKAVQNTLGNARKCNMPTQEPTQFEHQMQVGLY